MTTDMKVPSVFGILTGEYDFGEFIAFSVATRMTYKEAVKKNNIRALSISSIF